TPTQPAPRYGAELAYDAARARLVMFGGGTDTWEWDGLGWEDRTPAGLSPTAFDGHRMAYDAERGKVVLFGGHDGVDFVGDTWTWDGNAWTHETPSDSPTPRRDVGLAWDRGLKRVVLVGGTSATGTETDTWTWTGTDWTDAVQASASLTPASLAEDPLRGTLVLFGYDSASSPYTATWSGAAWMTRTPAQYPSA